MYISQLMVNIGDNPDRPRPGRNWLSNVYHMHQRLSMAFPSQELKEKDPQFLLPYDTHQFQPARFLFRIDHPLVPDSPRAMIIVQSDLKPDWEYAFQNVPDFLSAPPDTREYLPREMKNQPLRYRIRVNLSRKSRKYVKEDATRTDSHGRPKSQGKRIALTWGEDQKPEEVIIPWFQEKALIVSNEGGEAVSAFRVDTCEIVHLGWTVGYRKGGKSSDGEGKSSMRFRSALLEGVLTVENSALFSQLLSSGIGSAKAFGFGLLSVVPQR